eukprot:GHRQ01028325.1.p3 GENE.GHRQ01028325.1~~GHRQ01028325.1.p3  ORF type:complete len:104 (+),score=9.28 GHRQ01028325.1:1321-1632(+)
MQATVAQLTQRCTRLGVGHHLQQMIRHHPQDNEREPKSGWVYGCGASGIASGAKCCYFRLIQIKRDCAGHSSTGFEQQRTRKLECERMLNQLVTGKGNNCAPR